MTNLAIITVDEKFRQFIDDKTVFEPIGGEVVHKFPTGTDGITSYVVNMKEFPSVEHTLPRYSAWFDKDGDGFSVTKLHRL